MSADPPRAYTDNPSALPVGTRLGEYEVRSLLGVGGFGIVYLAFDHALEREVAVKEYMPAILVGRTETMHVSLRSKSDAETFALGLKSFVNEARLLARFDHASLLKVHRFWEANGTAYMAMPVLRGRTVKEVRQAMPGAPDEAWLRALLDPLLGAIEALHGAGVYHRDIAPDNIQIEPDGRPVLLDFGAARRVISDKTQTLTAILKPAYAPIEQYAESGAVKQGPWTDIYALGATLYYLLLGHPPAPATTRAVHDEASVLTSSALPGCSENFLRIVDWMLAPRPADRPQSIAALREALDGRIAPPRRFAAASQAPGPWERTLVLEPGAPDAATAAQVDASERTQHVPRALSAADAPPPVPPPPAPPPRREPPARAAAAVQDLPTAARDGARIPSRVALGAGLGAVLLAGVAALSLWPKSPPAVQRELPASAALAGAPASAAPLELPAAQPAASAVAESAVATVVVGSGRSTPGAGGAAPAASAPPHASPGRPHVAARIEPRSVRAEPATAGAAAPAAPPLDAAVPKAEVAAAPRPPRPSEVPKPMALGPDAKCSGRGAFSRIVCMEKECLRPENANHPDCLKWHAGARHE